MSKKVIIILVVLVLLGSFSYAAYKKARVVANANPVFVNGRIFGISNGNLRVGITYGVDNPTSGSLNVRTPIVTLFMDGTELGRSMPTNENTIIQPRGRTELPEIMVDIPLLTLAFQMPRFWTLISQGGTANMKASMILAAEGISVPYDYDFQLTIPPNILDSIRQIFQGKSA